MVYARGLRATDQRAQAVAVLEQASIRNPTNMPLLGAYGRALAEAGDLNQALEVLGRAHTPDNPDWRVLNAQGAPETSANAQRIVQVIADDLK